MLGPPPLLLNNYRATGIGDFGAELLERLGPGRVRYVETRPDGRGVLGQLKSALSWHAPVLANLGLTAWGDSAVRNFLGYSSLALRIRSGRRTVVFVHNLIEALDAGSAGYPISTAVRLGAHRAVAMLRGGELVVFSRTVADLLRTEYGTAPKLLAPIPCSPSRRLAPAGELDGQVVVPGYLAPYKGHDRLPAVKALLDPGVGMSVVGGPHRVLAQTSVAYRRDLANLHHQLNAAGINVLGWVPDEELDRRLARSTVALLPYLATQGASAMFSRVASVGTPAVASELPEFAWLEGLGAGLLLVPPTPEGLARGLTRVLTDRRLRSELSARQLEFSNKYSWGTFLSRLGVPT
jgi:glycosyltransferase involved in cell wall biosynthesis